MASDLNAKLSEEQQAAVNFRDGNLLVAAGAGSGKTTVLVERVLSHLLGENPTDIDRLLVLTFTNAAAGGLRARIEDALTARLRQNPAENHLHKQLALLQQAPITTLHSFCLDLVRRNFYRLGLDAGFRIPTETERAILREETITAFMEAEYSVEDGLLSQLADCYGGRRDDTALLALVDDLYQFSRSQPRPTEWLEQAADAFSPAAKLDDYGWSAFLLDDLRQQVALARISLDEARLLAAGQDIPLPWIAQLTEEMAAINYAIAAPNGWEGFLAALAAIEFGRLPTASKIGDNEAKEQFRCLRDSGKEAIRELQKRFGRRSPAAMLADLHNLAPLMRRLTALAIDYGAALDGEKRRRNLLDFDDMEHFCLRLLEDEANGVAAELAANFTEVLIDEYQDINAVQERILNMLTRGDNYFAVGDVKQSIYRFRLAEPTLFLQKYRDYGLDQGGKRIDLNRNYRSSVNVIHAVNFLFRQLMSEQVAELDYDEAAELKAGREDIGAAAELWLVERADAAEEAEDVAQADEAPSSAGAEQALPAAQPEEHALAAEARLIGRRMLELHAQGYAFRDMAVLLRAAKNREAVLGRELALMGIPAVAAGHGDYNQTPEIGLMLSLLAVIDNPLQEIELAAVLRSPLFGFTLDELAQLRFAAPGCELLNGLEVAAQGEGDFAARCQAFLGQLQAWRDILRHSRVSELIWHIYRETGLYQLAGALPEGGQRQENLLLLYQRAQEYEAGSYRGLFRFLLFLADGRGKGADGSAELAEGEDAVSVMSIHRSKGLEFPVVFVANVSGAFSMLDEKRDVIFHKQLGLGAKVADLKQRRKFPSLAHEAIAHRLHKEALAEEMRVLYVALTRARDKLILTAGVKDIGKAATSWYGQIRGQGQQLNGSLLAQDKRPLDWLGKALLRHRDAGPLRRAAGIAENSAEEQSLILPSVGAWQCFIVPKEELKSTEQLNGGDAPLFSAGQTLPESPQKQQVDAVLGYKYPWAEFCHHPAKWTVSELNKLSQISPQEAAEEAASLAPTADQPETRPPAGVDGNPAAAEQAARRGTAQHKLLQNLVFGWADSKEAVQQQLREFQQSGLFTNEEAALVDTAAIARFAATPLARRFAQAQRTLREAAFTYALPAVELNPAAALGDKLVLQGMLDAAFYEDGGWVLLDYKTGGYGQTEQQLQEGYAAQMAYYRRALEDIWGSPVKEAWLCFIDLGKNILINN